MTPLADVRIVVWEGGSLWVLDSSRLEPVERRGAEFHAHHAVQIVIALKGTFRLSTREASLVGGSAAVAPDTPHAFEAEGRFALLFVEPESPAGRAITALLFADADLRAPPPEIVSGFAPRLSEAYDAGLVGRAQLAQIGQALVERLAAASRPKVLDPRVRRVIAWTADANEEPASLPRAAAVAGLSPERLRHLFVSETGLSLKTYLLWRRLNRAVTLAASGASLTAAAHEAGFSDSAHFSRTFRRMFGVAPVTLKIT